MPKHFSPRLILIGIILIATTLRFYNLMWGNGDFFNPDERNMAGAISQFRLPKHPLKTLACIQTEFKPSNHTSSTNKQVTDSTDCNLNPHFFAYGQFPLYLAYVSGIIVDTLYPPVLTGEPINQATNQLSFPQAIFWLRFWSATTSILTVFVIYRITKQLFTHRMAAIHKHQAEVVALLSATFVTFTPGLIQSAHFGTTESMLTFFFTLILYFSLNLLTITNIQWKTLMKYSIGFSIIIGLALGTKISALAFVPPFFLALGLRTITSLKSQRSLKQFLMYLSGYLNVWIFILFLVSAITILASPYNLMEISDFRGAINYETAVAQGLKVFYTRQFENTLPIIFQAGSILPYALGPALFMVGTVGLILLFLKTTLFFFKTIFFKKKLSVTINSSTEESLFVILLVAFFTYFLPSSILYTKWTRFMNPVFPLFSIFASYALYYGGRVFIYVRKKTAHSNTYPLSKRVLKYVLFGMSIGLLFQLIAPGLAYIHIYTKEDVRTSASRWIYKNIPSGTYILSETGNVIDIPTSFPSSTDQEIRPPSYTLNPVSFDFYHLDENSQLQSQLIDELEKAEYIFIPSRRLFANSMRISQQLPITTRYYNVLFSGALGFEEIAAFTSFPSLFGANQLPMKAQEVVPYDQGVKNGLMASIIFLTDGYMPDEGAEETWSVFDHPVIRIYKKNKQYTKEEYQALLRR